MAYRSIYYTTKQKYLVEDVFLSALAETAKIRIPVLVEIAADLFKTALLNFLVLPDQFHISPAECIIYFFIRVLCKVDGKQIGISMFVFIEIGGIFYKSLLHGVIK